MLKKLTTTLFYDLRKTLNEFEHTLRSGIERTYFGIRLFFVTAAQPLTLLRIRLFPLELAGIYSAGCLGL